MKITRRDRLCGQGLRIAIGSASIVHFLVGVKNEHGSFAFRGGQIKRDKTE